MATIHWAAGISGDWGTAGDWTGNRVPGATSNVFIDPTGTYTVTIDSAEAALALTVDEKGATVADDNTLTIGTTFTVTAGTFDLNSGGEIAGGTLSATGGVFTWNGGTLDAVTYWGPLNLTATDSDLMVTGGLTAMGADGVGAGVINLTGSDSSLDVAGGETFSNATLNIGAVQTFGGSGAFLFLYDPNDTGSALTFSRNFTIVHTVGQAVIEASYDSDRVINNGTMTLAAAGGSFGIYSCHFVNNGTITVSNGDEFYISDGTLTNRADGTISINGAGTSAVLFYSNFTNAGKIIVSSGASLALGGLLWTKALESITDSAGTIALTGTLTNRGAALTVGPGSSLPFLELGSGIIGQGGVVIGGTIVDQGSGIEFNGAELVGVTFDGTVDMSADKATLSISGGFKANGAGGAPGVINLTGIDSALTIAGGETLDNATLNMGSYATLYLEPQSDRVVLGADFRIVEESDSGTISVGYDGTVVNNGTITASGPDAKLYIEAGTFAGSGEISVGGGATLEVDSTTASRLAMDFDGGGTLALGDPSAFGAAISGFGSADTIDLLRITATNAALGARDTLVITNGSQAVATLQLAGNYSGDTFSVQSDGNGGSSITIVSGGGGAPPAAPHAPLASVPASHQLISAMAGFGAGAGGMAISTGDLRPDALQAMLTAPRLSLA